MFLSLTFLELFVIVSIRNREPFWQGKRASLPLSIAISLAFLFSLALPYVPITARLFSFTPLPLQDLGILLALTVSYVFALDAVKVWYHRLTTQMQKPAQTK
jgi:Mg2+-importing ATPase